VEARLRALRVSSPTSPSTSSALRIWKSRTALSRAVPNTAPAGHGTSATRLEPRGRTTLADRA
jgi:hypothetical protein